ncbi:MAG: protein jag [Myxococcota bacterium]
MYDARQEPNEFIADSLKDAKANACQFFEVEESDLRFVISKDGEIYGATGRSVVVATPKNITSGPPRGNSDDGGRGGDRGPRKESRGGRERGERGGRSEGRGGRGGRERGGRGENRSQAQEPEKMSAEPQAAVANSKGKAKGDIGPIGEFLLGAVERMKLGSFDISESSEGDFLIYQLSGPAAEALQGGDGRATDALQLVANQVSMRQSEDAPRIVVDVEGGGDERDDTMNRLADRAIKRARETGRSIALDPMNSRDRRAIHIAIRDVKGVATMSIGEGRYRQVLVVPEGAPEYEDALADA